MDVEQPACARSRQPRRRHKAAVLVVVLPVAVGTDSPVRIIATAGTVEQAGGDDCPPGAPSSTREPINGAPISWPHCVAEPGNLAAATRHHGEPPRLLRDVSLGLEDARVSRGQPGARLVDEEARTPLREELLVEAHQTLQLEATARSAAPHGATAGGAAVARLGADQVTQAGVVEAHLGHAALARRCKRAADERLVDPVRGLADPSHRVHDSFPQWATNRITAPSSPSGERASRYRSLAGRLP